MEKPLAASRLLGPEREQTLARVRAVLGDLRAALAKLRAEPDDDAAAKRAAAQLDDLFLLVVVGEFNSGKSAFVNALLGQTVLEEGVTPTTSRIQALSYGPEVVRVAEGSGLDRITAPVAILEDLRLVDTPGTNAIDREHEAITQHFIPQADLVLFVTSADRPFTESERSFLAGIREWGKKVVLVINKIDILEKAEEVERVKSFVRESFEALLGVEPEIFAVAARPAFRAKQAGDDEKLAASGFPALEAYLRSTLDAQERFRLKLLNLIGVATRLSSKYAEVVERRLEVLEGDIAEVEAIKGQLDVYEKDLREGFALRMSDIDLILHQFEGRGHEFFEEMIRVGRVFDLVNKSKVKADFEREVVADAPQRIEDKVHDIIDWLVTSDLQQWRVVRERLEQRKSEHAEQIVGKLSGGFEYDRTRLLDTVGKVAQETLRNYDKGREAHRMAESVQNAVTNAALLEVGAVGLGAAVSLIATSSTLDATGIAAAGVMAVLGLFVLPHRRSKAKAELREKISTLRTQLTQALESQFQKEIARSRSRIEETIAPYTRFVRAERDELSQRAGELAGVQSAAEALKAGLGG
ncbi:MAG: dynamin family protein [Bryobacterales bacterium]|nr:dynamin family protein [Bryobacterales bacterium]